MFAVVRTGGKQYRVAKDDVIVVEKLAGEAGETIVLGDVLAVGDAKSQTVGTPVVSGASVAVRVLEQTRGDKIIVFKKKRRQGYRRKRGHRQELTALRVTEILTGGKKPTPTKPAAKAEAKAPATAKKADPEAKKPAAKPKAEAKPKPAAKTEAKKPAAKKPAAKPAAKKADAKPAAKKAPAKKAPAKKPAADAKKK